MTNYAVFHVKTAFFVKFEACFWKITTDKPRYLSVQRCTSSSKLYRFAVKYLGLSTNYRTMTQLRFKGRLSFETKYTFINFPLVPRAT